MFLNKNDWKNWKTYYKLIGSVTIFAILIGVFCYYLIPGMGETGKWGMWTNKNEEGKVGDVFTYAGNDVVWVLTLFFGYFAVQTACLSAVWLFKNFLKGNEEGKNSWFTGNKFSLALVSWSSINILLFLIVFIPNAIINKVAFDNMEISTLWWIVNSFLYLVIPTIMIAYFIFGYNVKITDDLRKIYTVKNLLLWAIYPLIYFVIIIFRAQIYNSTWTVDAEYSNQMNVWVYSFLNFNGENKEIWSQTLMIIAISSGILALMPSLIWLSTKGFETIKFRTNSPSQDTEFVILKEFNFMSLADWKTAKHYFKMAIALMTVILMMYTISTVYKSGSSETARYVRYINKNGEITAVGGDLTTALGFMFGMFTFQSNLLVMIWFVLVFIKGGNEDKGSFTTYYWSMAVSVYITVTFIIFNFLMLPTVHKNGAVDGGEMNAAWWAMNMMLHTVAPLCMIFYFVFWYKKSNYGTTKELFTSKKILWILSYPVVYALVIVVRGEILYLAWNNNYGFAKAAWIWPYPFLNIRNTGWITDNMPGYVSLIVAVFIIAGIIFGFSSAYNASIVSLENKINNKDKKKVKNSKKSTKTVKTK
ncbi:Pr6Pr family membrane protein [Spiroplasma monobiae]|uniref:Transmembrane protein n=1 Tax=Spiroplasma monobiae MQ-1 TaxID=1336748 RepID=A0A2K9LV17_SPISQ|nr:Pr6Pr family membrane protein [Spiroplasma monobiae]AUM62887.1 hypothetical protein SMONO_v1c06380 [Spiroplasma monobiae MQ-1]